MTFAQKLQELRKAAGLSQEELAEKLGVSRQSVSKWELGQAYPETEKIIELSRMYGVSLDVLLKGEEPPAPAGSPERASSSRPPWLTALAVLAILIVAVTALFFVCGTRGPHASIGREPASKPLEAASFPVETTLPGTVIVDSQAL